MKYYSNSGNSKNNAAGLFAVVMALVFFGVAAYYFSMNEALIVSGTVVNMNDYINNSSEYVEQLPMSNTVSLRFDKCYGQFYTYTTGGYGRHSSRTDHYLYAIGLDDGSVMALETHGTDLDNLNHMAEVTLESGTTDGLELVGVLHELRNGDIKDRFINHIDVLKTNGTLSPDIKVRYVQVNYSGDRGLVIFTFITFIVFGVSMVILALKECGGNLSNIGQTIKANYLSKEKAPKNICVFILTVAGYYAFLILEDEGRTTDSAALKNRLIISFIMAIGTNIAWSAIDSNGTSTPRNNNSYDILNNDLGDVIKHKKRDEFYAEVMENGYSQKMFDTANKVIDSIKKHKPDDIYNYKDYILLPAEYCNLKGDYNKAKDYLDIFTDRDLMNHEFFRVDHGVSAFRYWAVKFETLRGLGDTEGADKLFAEAARYWDNKYMMEYEKNYLRGVCFYHYYMLKGDMTKAFEVSEKFKEYIIRDTNAITMYVLNAEVRMMLGKKDSAAIVMEKAKESINNGPATLVQVYEEYMKRLGLNSLESEQ